MAQILVGTRDGLHRCDASGNALGVEHAGREVTTIAPEGWELWAILDGKEVVHTAGVDWWFHVANLSGLRGNCIADTRAGVILGTSEGHLFRIAVSAVQRDVPREPDTHLIQIGVFYGNRPLTALDLGLRSADACANVWAFLTNRLNETVVQFYSPRPRPTGELNPRLGCWGP